MTALALLELARCLEPGQLAEVTVALFSPAAHGLDKRGSDVDFLDVHVPRRSQQLLLVSAGGNRAGSRPAGTASRCAVEALRDGDGGEGCPAAVA